MSGLLTAFMEYKDGLLEKKSGLNGELSDLGSDYFEFYKNIGIISLINALSVVGGTNPAQAAGEAISDIEPEIANMIDNLKAGSEIHKELNQINAQLGDQQFPLVSKLIYRDIRRHQEDVYLRW